MTKKKVIYAIDGKPAKLQDIRSSTQDAMLKEALGEKYTPSRLNSACEKALVVDLIDVRRLELVSCLISSTTWIQSSSY